MQRRLSSSEIRATWDAATMREIPDATLIEIELGDFDGREREFETRHPHTIGSIATIFAESGTGSHCEVMVTVTNVSVPGPLQERIIASAPDGCTEDEMFELVQDDALAADAIRDVLRTR